MATKNSDSANYPNVNGLNMGPTGSSSVTYYKLRAYDSSCVSPTAVIWTDTTISLTNAPAFPCSGPYVNLTVISQWTI